MPQFRQLCIHFNIFILYASSVCIEIRKKGQKGGKGKKSFVFWLMLSLCICTSIKSNIHHRQRPLDLCYVISYTYFKLNYQNRKNVLVSWSKVKLQVKLQVQGVRGQSGFFNLALRERNIQVRLCLKVVLKS